MSQQKQLVGQVVAGRYRIEQALGQGAMGAVFRAWDLQLKQPCAIKTLHRLVELEPGKGPGRPVRSPGGRPDLGAPPMGMGGAEPDGEKEAGDDGYSRFVSEATAITQLFHPNIVEVRELSLDRGTPFLAMELLRGQDLYSLLQARGRLPLIQALEIARQIGSALHAAHSTGIAHRDIKPKNIFLSRRVNCYGEEFEQVKVVDFGLCRFLGRAQRHRTKYGVILGTPEYLAPESTQGDSRAVDYAADQWALSVILYRMLSGRLPFVADDLVTLIEEIRGAQPTSLAVLCPEVPPHVVLAVERGLAKRPQDRFRTVQDFVRALDGLPPVSQVLESRQAGAAAPALIAPTLCLPGVGVLLPRPAVRAAGAGTQAAGGAVAAAGVETVGTAPAPGHIAALSAAVAGARPSRAAPRSPSDSEGRGRFPRRVAIATLIGVTVGLLLPLSVQQLVRTARRSVEVTKKVERERAVDPDHEPPPAGQ